MVEIDTIINITNSQSSNNTPSLKYTITYAESILSVLLSNTKIDGTNECFNIELKLKIPSQIIVEELIYRLCSFREEQFVMLEIQEIELLTNMSTKSNVYDKFKFLINYDDEFLAVFRKELEIFVKKQNQAFYDNLAAESIRINAENSPLNASFRPNIISYWKTILSNEHLNTNISIGKLPNSENDLNMGKIYHSLIHSSQMLNVLQRERNYAIELNGLLRERDQTLRYVMDETQLDAETAKWSVRVTNLKNRQQRNFKKFLQKLYDQIDQRKSHISEDEDEYVYELNEQLNSLDTFKESFTNVPSASAMSGLYSKSTILEESYTIQLGAQLKSTHNLRLIRCNIFDFCKDRFVIDENSEPVKIGGKKDESMGELMAELEPQAIQTAMSLYSDKLCALILLVENTFDAENEEKEDEENCRNEVSSNNAANWRYLVDICEKNGCEFHFPLIEDQKKLAFHYASAAKKNHSKTKFSDMNIGDFFITKHSNLSQVHAIFHLVSNEKKANSATTCPIPNPTSPTKTTLKLPDLSSRHPVILGLRNILKACISNNINTLTLPLLLTHEMNEEMTISWVMKRAELVLKCLKGFMIEFVQWGAQDSRTIQFVVPHGLMDETFNSLSNLIPTIFRESRTVNLV